MKKSVKPGIKHQSPKKKACEINKHVCSYIMAIALVTSIFGCQSKPSQPGRPNTPPPPGVALTHLGNNDQVQISKDGTKIIYSTSKRVSHANSEIYELNIESGKERRLTYQDGENRYPHFSADGRGFFFLTDTDSKKMAALSTLLKKNSSSNLENEIYFSDFPGLRIRKALNRPKLASDSSLSVGLSDSLVYVTHSDKESAIKKGENQTLALGKAKELSFPAANKITSDVAWVEGSAIAISNGRGSTQRIHLLEGNIRDLEWAPNPKEKSLLFSADFKIGRHALFLLNLDKKCFAKILDHNSSNLTAPVLSPDLKTLIYLSDWGGDKQIYRTEVDWEKLNCLPFDKP